ncbi:hypothetical protein SAMN05880582_101211 [Rhizobium sp. RU20A]|uniref:hypothetical protein n=1 Tax=Rhizobium sp. RU20A TaxID=1907412 RepID=UPI0009550567|nr:hypothetical protein [Rhizobium sp. RU20A]SIP97000.1 hypothetical protein SAMN05880582_101211 [Rhizobium sp. RU20A]
MKTRPAYEQVTIAHGGNTVALRPTLRAAATLTERHGFPALFQALDSMHLTITSEIIRTASSPVSDAAAFLRSEAAGRPLSPFFLAVRQPLAELIAMFMPAPDPKAKPSSAGKPTPWNEYFAELYSAATGWLGWTPETTWNATPTEITRALSAHHDRLVITGVLTRTGTPTEKTPDPEQAARNEAEGLDPEFDREGLRALKAKIAGGV